MELSINAADQFNLNASDVESINSTSIYNTNVYFQQDLAPPLINVYYQNVRGLRSKTFRLLTATSDAHYDLIALTETWLCNGICNSEIFDLCLCNVFRTDRSFEKTGLDLGGGVLLAVLNTIKCVEIAYLIL